MGHTVEPDIFGDYTVCKCEPRVHPAWWVALVIALCVLAFAIGATWTLDACK